MSKYYDWDGYWGVGRNTTTNELKVYRFTDEPFRYNENNEPIFHADDCLSEIFADPNDVVVSGDMVILDDLDSFLFRKELKTSFVIAFAKTRFSKEIVRFERIERIPIEGLGKK
jgi:hypothetical protein